MDDARHVGDEVADREVVVIAYDDAELLDVACITSTLAMAVEHGARPGYRAVVATPAGRPVVCASGLTLQAQRAIEHLRGRHDTLIVSGGRGPEAVADDPALVGHIRRAAGRSRRVASVCTGATILAATGLLDGRRAATHWVYARRLAARHPHVTVDADPIYIRDGNVLTSAGVTSALDLTLALVEEDHGPDLARRVARMLVTYLQRPGNQAQMSMFLESPAPEHHVVRRVVDHIASHLAADLGLPTLAARAGVSERHLSRLFVAEVGVTPARFVRDARTEAAAQLLVSSSTSVEQVSQRCGFRTAEALRQAFVARYGTPPSQYRVTQSGATG